MTPKWLREAAEDAAVAQVEPDGAAAAACAGEMTGTGSSWCVEQGWTSARRHVRSRAYTYLRARARTGERSLGDAQNLPLPTVTPTTDLQVGSRDCISDFPRENLPRSGDMAMSRDCISPNGDTISDLRGGRPSVLRSGRIGISSIFWHFVHLWAFRPSLGISFRSFLIESSKMIGTADARKK